MRHAEKLAWPHEEFVEEEAELQQFAEEIAVQVYGEHPMEDEVDRALGLYPGTYVERADAPALRVPVLRMSDV